MARYIAFYRLSGNSKKGGIIYFRTVGTSPHPRALSIKADDVLADMKKRGEVPSDAEICKNKIFKLPKWSSKRVEDSEEEIDYCPQAY